MSEALNVLPAETVLLENDQFRVLEGENNFTIYQKKIDDFGTPYVHKSWQSQNKLNSTGDMESLLITILSQLSLLSR